MTESLMARIFDFEEDQNKDNIKNLNPSNYTFDDAPNLVSRHPRDMSLSEISARFEASRKLSLLTD